MPVEHALEVRGLKKSYAGVTVLHGLDWDVRAGEIHALMGQNGCGKSTLIKTISGYHDPDSGSARLFGRELSWPFASPDRHGIGVIHQDLGLVEKMTVLENLGVNASYGTSLLRPIKQRAERRTYERLLERVEVDVDLDAPVDTLSPAERALVAVVRVMRTLDAHEGRELFVLDEPTASLSRPEAAKVLKLMRRVADLGAGVIFVSHRISEVLSVADRVTVIRDGRHVLTADAGELTKSTLVTQMLGRRMQEFYPRPPQMREATRLEVRGVSGRVVQDVSFSVRAGEVLGVTGLAGMGQDELPYLVAGTRTRTGEVAIDGAPLPAAEPRAAIDAGVVLVPGNRHRDGCWTMGTAAENVTLPVLERFGGRLRLRRRNEQETAARLVADAGVRPPEPHRQMRRFSGGNQQKIVFAKWLQMEPKVLVLDEPTQGVDAGAGHDILERVHEAARQGAAVLVASGDHEQLSAACHRVIVLQDGVVVTELSGEELTEEALIAACEHRTTEAEEPGKVAMNS